MLKWYTIIQNHLQNMLLLNAVLPQLGVSDKLKHSQNHRTVENGRGPTVNSLIRPSCISSVK